MTIEQYWQLEEQGAQQEVQRALRELGGQNPGWPALLAEVSRLVPSLFRTAIDQVKRSIILELRAGVHSFDAADVLTRDLLDKGRMQLMVYLGESGNAEYPQQMALIPSTVGGNYELRPYKGINQSHLQAKRPMIAIQYSAGEREYRSVCTAFPAHGALSADWQVHWDYGYRRGNRHWPLVDLYARSCAEHSRQLVPVVERFGAMINFEIAHSRLNELRRQRQLWDKVCLPDKQLLEILKQVTLFTRRDPARPQGLLLKGVPGTGKTMLANAIAEVIKCNFSPLRLADLKHPQLGKSAQAVRDIWQLARSKPPSIIFIDECESVFGKRGAAETDAVATDVVQAILGEWNGKEQNVWIIGATNRRDLIDEAILSRFDSEMEIALPNEELRKRILIQEIRALGVSDSVPQELGGLTQGFSGRDLASLAKKVRMLAYPGQPKHDHYLTAVNNSRVSGNTAVDTRSSWATLILPTATLSKLKTICAVLRDVEGWRSRGVTVPNGMLLVGPPGTGKTETARTLANESGLTFIAASTADVKANFLGQSGNRVKNLFERARASAPAILFLDELDIIAPIRAGKANDPLVQEIVGQLLQEMDGVRHQSVHVFLLGATNYPEMIDPAVLSRLPEKIEIPLPDEECRRRLLIMMLDSKQKAFTSEQSGDFLVRMSNGMSGRDLKNWISASEQRAVARAVADGGPEHFALTLEDFEYSRSPVAKGVGTK